MKKIIGILLIILAMFGFNACNNNDGALPPSGGGGQTGGSTGGASVGASSVMVAYFSCTDTTKGVAEHIAEETRGTLYEITPAVPYTADDLKYYTDCRADREQADPSARPQIDGKAENMDDHDIVFLGYPIWHG